MFGTMENNEKESEQVVSNDMEIMSSKSSFKKDCPGSDDDPLRSKINKIDIMHEGRGGDSPYPEAKDWRELVALTWADYKFTWVGFLGQNKIEEVVKEENEALFDEDKIREKQKEIRTNVDRNIEKIKEGGDVVLHEMKDITGIYNKRDLKKWAMEQLKLANECVASFMKGYREGRDEEVDKMMNEYFKDIDFDVDDEDEDEDDESEEENKAKRRVAGRRRRRMIHASTE